MKRRITALLLALAMALPLTGCSLLERSYSSVERYSSSYYESEDRDVLQPETYQELVNALLVAVSRKKNDDLAHTFQTLEDIWDEYGVYEKVQD